MAMPFDGLLVSDRPAPRGYRPEHSSESFSSQAEDVPAEMLVIYIYIYIWAVGRDGILPASTIWARSPPEQVPHMAQVLTEIDPSSDYLDSDLEEVDYC